MSGQKGSQSNEMNITKEEDQNESDSKKSEKEEHIKIPKDDSARDLQKGMSNFNFNSFKPPKDASVNDDIPGEDFEEEEPNDEFEYPYSKEHD